MELKLAQKNAIVTGGASGLGSQVIRQLAKEGVNIAFSYLSSEKEVHQFVESIQNDYDVKVVAIEADLADEKQLNHFFEASVDYLETIDILINNAAIWLTGQVEEITSEEWDLTMMVNLKSPFLLSQLFVNHKKKLKSAGHIVNITSQAAFHGSTTGHAHYAASKAGLVTFSISLAREVAQYGINVNNVAVGIMRTKMIEKKFTENPDYYLNRIPVGRVSEPKEIAKIVVFLASEVASYMTGATVDVTGGMLMR
ncbi:SDR family oxidoreductase [Vagococcus sp. DIV0080]|uniref:SDR family oxidoreductase n=1 Tax=Candidatus Vagococcus giribetii TaxID=2230876 RepID=A0ABS3HV22_9ENTE|nr:SDR family oxidoreductase [Vagococcus sp. DIV0080]MBO0476691.1 SDR family oxidoreductase [Vagococcus sp. DIV0080]